MTKEYANKKGYSDVDPYEVVETRTEKKKMIRAMDAVRDPNWKPEMIPGGFVAHTVNNGSQKWIITSNETYEAFAIRQHKDKRWRDKFGNVYQIAQEPRKFYDYNF